MREPARAELFVFEPDDIEPLVTVEVGGSALFAHASGSAPHALCCSPSGIQANGRRSGTNVSERPNCSTSQRKYPDFPIILETVRECLQDVYDVPTLTDLMTRIGQRRVRLVEVETPVPSPFAAALSSATWVPSCMRATALGRAPCGRPSLDTTLLAELFGRVELRELLDPDIVEATRISFSTFPKTVRPRMPKVLPTYCGYSARSRPTKSPRDRLWLMPALARPVACLKRALQVGYAGRTWGRDRGHRAAEATRLG